ncbi:MAG: Holliday junction resolvase RuvX [Candidatus Omnitrophica bacterium]|nr:Holliday junction resolvase RuvX [Candidatus Omnitrophota bacterium]
MGIDIGTKNVGIAISDELCMLAQGREVIKRRDDRSVICRIKEQKEEYDVREIVVGFPINMNGSIGASGEKAQQFAELLKKEFKMEVILWDERLTTREAESVMIEASMSRKKRKTKIDKMAAQLILQSYLDSLRVENDEV